VALPPLNVPLEHALAQLCNIPSSSSRNNASKNGYVMAQEYLPAVKKGDKRILLINGYPIFVGDQPAIYLRVSPKGEIRSNMHIGGRRKKAKMTASDLRIIEAIRPKLNSDGLYFVGIDIVGNKLLEVNVFCPGGINNINELYGINVGRVVIQDLERQVRFRQMGLSTRRVKGKTAEWVVQ
jgi:glutathione synthase